MAQGFVVTAALLWAVSGLITKGLLEAGIGPLEITFWRSPLGGSAFLFHASMRHELRLKTRTDLGVVVGLAVGGLALHFASFALAVDYGGVSLAALSVALGAWLFLGERMTRPKMALIAVSVLGLGLVSLGGGRNVQVSALALLWGGVAALTLASYDLVGKWLLRRYSPLVLSAFLMPLAALGLLPFVSFTVKTPQHWLMLVVLAGLATYLGHLLYQTGLRRLEASRAALLVSVEPAMAVSLAALVFGERLAPLGLFGSGLILSAAVVTASPFGPLKRKGILRGSRTDATLGKTFAQTPYAPFLKYEGAKTPVFEGKERN